ncbi:MAG TPA: NupC/NupG family nucleoside CNT transporter [Thermoanaerobaculia bacterium]|nr:NupC/NupG family nucleoside CNT transporter [Thermoanaerobaculia bacterium]
MNTNFVAALGLVAMLLIAWLLSNNRRRIPWRTVITGTLLQFAFALLILKTSGGEAFFARASDLVTAFLDFSDAGARFVFGDNFTEHFFAFKVLPTIIFFSSFITVLYYLNVLQWVVKGFAWVMMRIMGTSGAESLSASGNIFVGQTEAPLLIRPYVATMTNSELMAVMTGGFATIAGGVLAAYVGMGVPAGHLIAASVMSAPAALVMAKIMFPETEESLTAGEVKVAVEKPWVNVIDAAAEGAAAGLKLVLNVAAMLIAFLALIAIVNAALGQVGSWMGYPGVTLEGVFGVLLRPLAWLMGVPWEEADEVGTLLGIKTVLNEFVGYVKMEEMVTAGQLSERSEAIATYALCGFANFSSIAIQIGGIGGIAPERKGDLARLGLRAMIAGSLACFQTATIAGMLL